MAGDDYFECKTCQKVAVVPHDGSHSGHCPLCGSPKGRVVPAAVARRLFELGVLTAPDSSGKPRKTPRRP